MVLKRFLLTFLTCLSVTASFANVIPEREFVRRNYPGFQEVFTHVMLSLESYCDDCYYGIAKKPGGYYLSITPFDEDEPTKYVLVWDRNSVSFLEFDVAKYTSDQRLGPEPPEEFKSNYQQADFYDFYLYYGYNGWIEDTRALLNKYSDKSAEDLEILARTYANEATEAAHPGITQNYVDLGGLFEDKGYAKTGSTQTAFFEEAANKAIDYWKELKRTYPEYKSFNGDAISLKLSSEYMHFYELANSIKASSLSSTFFKNIYYDKSWVQFSRNLLGSCEKNGILFTSNSKDTYPLLYAQEKLGIREDVIVINTSLLNTSWYWEMLKESSQLASTIDKKKFALLSDKPIFVDRSAESAPFKQWIENELNSETENTYRLAPKELFLNYQSNNLNLELKTPVLTTSDIIIFDILTNNQDRAAFTSSPYGFVSIGLYYHMAPTGRAFALVSDRVAAMEEIKAIEQVEDFAFYTTSEYLQAIGTTAESELSTLSYLIINVSPVFQDRKTALVDKVYRNIPIKDAVATEDYALLDALNAFYEVMKPTIGEELQVQLQPIAEDLFLNTTSLDANLDSKIDALERIFSIYAHFRVHEVPEWSTSPDESAIPPITELERNILLQLQDKAANLFESPVVKQRDFSRRKVYRLLRALELLPLE